MSAVSAKTWMDQVIKQEEIDRYLIDDKDFIDDQLIEKQLSEAKADDPARVREIIQKSLSVQLLTPEETAILLKVKSPELYEEMKVAATKLKNKVYDNRIVTFAPLYCSNVCVNNCLYCGFRKENTKEKRRVLTMDEVKKEAEALISIGHKRLIMVYGESPLSGPDYIADSIKAVYDVKVKSRRGTNQIRRVNINAAPMQVKDLKKLWEAGIGTFQVFQETYHHQTYKEVHPSGLKANYQWRLYALHRALDAGIDDVAVGALFGLYDWQFEVMGMIYHAWDLENRFGVGPHTVSFPRLNPAEGSQYAANPRYKVSDDDFERLIVVLRLAIPYAGMILTARETAEIRRRLIPLGITQIDASTKIGIGAYSEQSQTQESERQQFMLGDTRSLDEVIRELADMGMITSFCTAGYRCGRTGDKIMGLLKNGTEGKFCKLNAILTFREWLDDFASPETQAAGERVIQKEQKEVKLDPFYAKGLAKKTEEYYERIEKGERDLYL